MGLTCMQSIGSCRVHLIRARARATLSTETGRYFLPRATLLWARLVYFLSSRAHEYNASVSVSRLAELYNGLTSATFKTNGCLMSIHTQLRARLVDPRSLNADRLLSLAISLPVVSFEHTIRASLIASLEDDDCDSSSYLAVRANTNRDTTKKKKEQGK